MCLPFGPAILLLDIYFKKIIKIILRKWVCMKIYLQRFQSQWTKLESKSSICNNSGFDKLWCFNTMEYNGIQHYKWCRRGFKYNNLLLSIRDYKTTCVLWSSLRVFIRIYKYKAKIIHMEMLTAGIVRLLFLFLFCLFMYIFKNFYRALLLF